MADDVTALPASRPRFWLRLSAVYWLLMVAAMHVPIPPAVQGDPRLPPNSDKTVHYVMYGALAVVICRAVDESRGVGRRPSVAFGYAAVFIACLIYGAIDELTQPLTGRRCEWADWLADVGGTSLGIVAALFWNRRRTAVELRT